MSAEESCDLSAFPILRLDELPRIDSSTLTKAASEVTHLLNDEKESRLSVYLRKQLVETHKELAQRRIRLMLNDEELKEEEHKEEEHTEEAESLADVSVSRETPVAPLSRAPPQIRLPTWSAADVQTAQTLRSHSLGSGLVVGGGGHRRRFYPKRVPADSRKEEEERGSADRLARRLAAVERLASRRERRQQLEIRRRAQARREAAARQREAEERPGVVIVEVLDAFDDSSSESLSDVDGGDDEWSCAREDVSLEPEGEMIALDVHVAVAMDAEGAEVGSAIEEGTIGIAEEEALIGDAQLAEQSASLSEEPAMERDLDVSLAVQADAAQEVRGVTGWKDSIQIVSDSTSTHEVQPYERAQEDKLLATRTLAALDSVRRLTLTKRASRLSPRVPCALSPVTDSSAQRVVSASDTFSGNSSERDGGLDEGVLSSIPPIVTVSDDPLDAAVEQRSDVDGKRMSLDHIGHLFPYAMSGSIGGAVNIRNLVLAMQTQLRLCESWVDVITDYATVFSDGSMDGATDARSALVYGGGSFSASALHFRVKSARSDVCNIVSSVFADLSSWQELPPGLGLASWNLLWTWGRPRLSEEQLVTWQRYNHFTDSKQLTRKDLLKRNLQRFTDVRSRAAESFEIMPLTFVLPHEYNQFVEAFTDHEGSAESNIWILKPIGLSRGRGISLIRDLAQLSYSQACVLQRYVERPLCLHGYKFDLRLYVLVTSFKPLEAFIYKEGFARVSTQRYSLSEADTSNRFIHLTNSSIQKQSAIGPSADNPVSSGSIDAGGSKLSLRGEDGLWRRLARSGVNTVELWRRICLLVVKSLVAVNDRLANQPCAFEVFGYDVLIDADLRPWLLEVNSSPSLARENSLDVRVKNAMIRDTIQLLDVTPFDRAALARVLRRRLNEMTKSKYSVPRHDQFLEADLKAILGKSLPRTLGDMPLVLGAYQRLCPMTDIWEIVSKMKSKIIREP